MIEGALLVADLRHTGAAAHALEGQGFDGMRKTLTARRRAGYSART
jgi:hypothetical protein